MPGRRTDERVRDLFDPFLDWLADELAERLGERLGGERQSAGLDTRQAAQRLGVSERTMRELVMSGQVKSVKVGRRRVVSAAAIDALLAANGTASNEPDPGSNWEANVPPKGAARRRRM
jgi:excisionase family DNA binding protein